jgi:site-specific DNA recombinase
MQNTSQRKGRSHVRHQGLAIRDLAPKSLQKKVLIYARVSTDAQDESIQVEMGQQVAHELGYTPDQVIVVTDHGVSARKVKMRERAGLVKAMNHAAAGDIAVMIVRDRDRIARNMVEYLEVWQKLSDAGVALVLSDTGATAVSNNFSEEAWNALMAEIEGDNIAGRTQAASRFYPSAPFGYEKVGRQGNTHYEFTRDIDDVKDLFEAFETVASRDEYKAFRAAWKKRMGRYPDKTLQNLFYAAAIPDGEGVKPLRHVEPIAPVETVLENQRRLTEWGYAALEKTQADLLQVFVPLYCNRCTATLEDRVRKGERTFFCPNCRKVRQSEQRLFNAIAETIHDVVSKLDAGDVQERVLSEVRMHRNRQLQEIQTLFQKRSKKGRELLDALTFGPIDKLLDEHNELELALQDGFREVRRLDNLAQDVQDLTELVASRVRHTAERCAEPIQRLLIDHVTVDMGSITVCHRFGDLMNEEAIV